MMKKQKAPEMKKHRNVYSKGDIAFNIVNYTVFFLITLACVFPFYYLFINTHICHLKAMLLKPLCCVKNCMMLDG